MERRQFLKLAGWTLAAGFFAPTQAAKAFVSKQQGQAIDLSEQRFLCEWFKERLKEYEAKTGVLLEIECIGRDEVDIAASGGWPHGFIRGVFEKDGRKKYIAFAYDPERAANLDLRQMWLENVVDQMQLAWKKSA